MSVQSVRKRRGRGREKGRRREKGRGVIGDRRFGVGRGRACFSGKQDVRCVCRCPVLRCDCGVCVTLEVEGDHFPVVDGRQQLLPRPLRLLLSLDHHKSFLGDNLRPVSVMLPVLPAVHRGVEGVKEGEGVNWARVPPPPPSLPRPSKGSTFSRNFCGKKHNFFHHNVVVDDDVVVDVDVVVVVVWGGRGKGGASLGCGNEQQEQQDAQQRRRREAQSGREAQSRPRPRPRSRSGSRSEPRSGSGSRRHDGIAVADVGVGRRRESGPEGQPSREHHSSMGGTSLSTPLPFALCPLALGRPLGRKGKGRGPTVLLLLLLLLV